jgi:hypothetical protein
LRVAQAVDPLAAFASATPKREPEPEMSAGLRALAQRITYLSQALAPKSHSQDVRSNAEKALDYEPEW